MLYGIKKSLWSTIKAMSFDGTPQKKHSRICLRDVQLSGVPRNFLYLATAYYLGRAKDCYLVINVVLNGHVMVSCAIKIILI